MTGQIMVAGDPTSIMRAYWSAMTTLRNLLEDVEGADGRIEYLRSLAVALVELVRSMDAALGTAVNRVSDGHGLAAALEQGASTLGLSAEDLREVVVEARSSRDFAALQAYLRQWGGDILLRFAGAVPEIQGTTGTREVLATLRRWERVCEATGSDFGFMTKLLNDL